MNKDTNNIELDNTKAIHNIVVQTEQLFCNCEEPNERWIGDDDDMYLECFKCRKDIKKL